MGEAAADWRSPGAAALPSCLSSALTFNHLELHCGPPVRITIGKTPVEASILGGELIEYDSVGAIAWLFIQGEPARVIFVMLLNQPLAAHQLRAATILSLVPATPVLLCVSILTVVGAEYGCRASYHTLHHRGTTGNCCL